MMVDRKRKEGRYMTNLILFLNAFMSYLFLFLFIVILIIAACFLGVKWRKSKDAKAALAEETENTGNAES